jgi:hypothetical protein
VFLDDRHAPYLVHKGWLCYWNNLNWVTLRRLEPGEYETLKKHKLPGEHAALYDWPCGPDSQPTIGGD